MHNNEWQQCLRIHMVDPGKLWVITEINCALYKQFQAVVGIWRWRKSEFALSILAMNVNWFYWNWSHKSRLFNNNNRNKHPFVYPSHPDLATRASSKYSKSYALSVSVTTGTNTLLSTHPTPTWPQGLVVSTANFRLCQFQSAFLIFLNLTPCGHVLYAHVDIYI